MRYSNKKVLQSSKCTMPQFILSLFSHLGRLPVWSVRCVGYDEERFLSDCRFRLGPSYCQSQRTWLTCSRKEVDTRVCRRIREKPCSQYTCFTRRACIEGDGNIIARGTSFCMHCPENGYYGDGDNCTGILLIYYYYMHEISCISLCMKRVSVLIGCTVRCLSFWRPVLAVIFRRFLMNNNRLP